MEEISNDNLMELLNDALIKLAREGEILAECPCCSILLDISEIETTTCQKCGRIDFEDILWKSSDIQADC